MHSGLSRCRAATRLARIWPLVIAGLLASACVQAQEVGDPVRLFSSNAQGVPVHPAAGDNSYVRWANGTTGRISAIDAASGWIEIDAAGSSGWVTPRYVSVLSPEEPEDGTLGAAIPVAVVGTWNLEWLKDGKSRGFPENTRGGPSYGPRTADDYRRIAEVIETRLGASIMLLQEINGESGTRNSVEMNRLLGFLGEDWAYELSASGGSQRVAILYDETAVRRNHCEEFQVPATKVQGSDIFARDPLACHLTFLDGSGAAKNDLLVVGLHLASGQDKTQNHDQAMHTLRLRLRGALTGGTFPAGERDILLGGDLNASRYDSKRENFWQVADPSGVSLDTLSPEDGEGYPGTRLAGVPLVPSSKIDYLLRVDRTGGLIDELVQRTAQVRLDLLPDNFNDFRRQLSDHIPVTVQIRIVPDDD